METNLLDLYSDYLICQNKFATATGLSKTMGGSISHDQITRFLNQEEFTSKDLWKFVKPEVRKHQQDEGGVLIIDDTIEEKPHTDENDTVCWHYSHAKGKCVKGINILSGLIRYNDFAVPIAYEAVRKEQYYSEVETKKEKRRSTVTKNEQFRDMIQQAVKNGVPFDYTLADSWFGSKENMLFIDKKLEKKFIFGIKANRLVALSEKEKKNGQYQNLKDLKLADKEVITVYLKGLSIPLQLLKRVFKNENGTTGVLYLVTNDLTIDAERIYDIYQKRWRIEEYHKSVKQNASLEKSPTKKPRTQRNHIYGSIIAYCKLEFLKCMTGLNHFALKYKLLIRANQMALQELSRLRAFTA